MLPAHLDDFVGRCFCCGKVWKRSEIENWLYHKSVGVVCKHHHGVRKWYTELLAKAKSELKQYCMFTEDV